MEYTNEPKLIGKIMEDYKLILPDGTINHDKIISLFNTSDNCPDVNTLHKPPKGVT